MACTEAVEEVIDGHYARQERALGDTEPELRETIRAFRAEELAHRDTARAEGAASAPGYRVLRRSVRGVDPAGDLAVGAGVNVGASAGDAAGSSCIPPAWPPAPVSFPSCVVQICNEYHDWR